MTVEEIRNYCLSLKGTTESIKWEDHLCFSVGGKMYLVIAPDKFPVSCSFKTSDELYDELTAREGIIPAPYMAKYKWVFTEDVKNIPLKEWNEFIQVAYQQVFEKLSGKMKKAISGS
jgi:predicted DNA-binding protein (MmcQ/YjbR family)